MDRVTQISARAVNDDLNGLAFHIADVLGVRWETIGPREQAIYRSGAKAALAAVRLIVELETEGVPRV